MFVRESITDVLKPKAEMTPEALDKLPLIDVIKMVEGKELVTYEGYGGENKLDFIPSYVTRRLRKEGTQLPNSYNSYNTWDSYSLYTIPDLKPPWCVMNISKKKTRGSAEILNIVKFKEITVIEREVDWEATREEKNKKSS